MSHTLPESINNGAWIALLHAEMCWALGQASVDVLIIKGPTLKDWLFLDDGRESVDVDLLVRPDHWQRAIEDLQERGFTETWEGRREDEVSDHSVDLQRHDSELGGHGVDLHKYFPGIDLPAAEAFDVLWERRVPGAQAGVDVWYPDVVARTLIVALHAARDPNSPKIAEDVRRALAALSTEQLSDLAVLARALDARGALRAGLETHPASAAYVERLGLGNVDVPTYWQLRSHGAGLTSLRLEQLRSLPWHQRPGRLAGWLFPSPALIRYRDPKAANGPGQLALGYVRRLRDGVRDLPRAIRDVRRARRDS